MHCGDGPECAGIEHREEGGRRDPGRDGPCGAEEVGAEEGDED